MKAIVMLENPNFDRCVGTCDVLDELEALARHSTASFAVIGQPIAADRMLHKL